MEIQVAFTTDRCKKEDKIQKYTQHQEMTVQYSDQCHPQAHMDKGEKNKLFTK